MSHPTQFRVWSKQSSKWMNNIVLSAQGTPILLYSEKVDDRVFHRVFLVDAYEPVVQWATGLKDKSGIDVFEGDILKLISEDAEVTVTWDTDHWSLNGAEESWSFPALPDDIEIIDTTFDRAARAALEAAATTAEKAAEPQIVV